MSQVFFKFTPFELKKLSRHEKHIFSFISDRETHDNQKNDQLYISFRREKDDLSIFFWVGNYSIGMTYTEFMQIASLLSDKNKLLSQIVAEEL